MLRKKILNHLPLLNRQLCVGGCWRVIWRSIDQFVDQIYNKKEKKSIIIVFVFCFQRIMMWRWSCPLVEHEDVFVPCALVGRPGGGLVLPTNKEQRPYRYLSFEKFYNFFLNKVKFLSFFFLLIDYDLSDGCKLLGRQISCPAAMAWVESKTISTVLTDTAPRYS